MEDVKKAAPEQALPPTPGWVERQHVYHECSLCGEHRREAKKPHSCPMPFRVWDSKPESVEEFASVLFEKVTPQMLDYIRYMISPAMEAAWRLAGKLGGKKE